VDEPIVELETDKVTLEVNAPASGILAEIIAKDGENGRVGALLGQSETAPLLRLSRLKPSPRPRPNQAGCAPPSPHQPRRLCPARNARLACRRQDRRRSGFDPAVVEGSGKRGQVLKGDVLATIAKLPAPTPAPAPARYPPDPGADHRRGSRGARFP